MSSKQNLTTVFNKESGEIHLGGIDALVRLTLDQVRTDARRGLKTGMFVSGYRGSPVGMLDAALIKPIRKVEALNTVTSKTSVVPIGRPSRHSSRKRGQSARQNRPSR